MQHLNDFDEDWKEENGKTVKKRKHWPCWNLHNLLGNSEKLKVKFCTAPKQFLKACGRHYPESSDHVDTCQSIQEKVSFCMWINKVTWVVSILQEQGQCCMKTQKGYWKSLTVACLSGMTTRDRFSHAREYYVMSTRGTTDSKKKLLG